ncbi:amino acid/polyamine/organocation transporter, APC superfamily (TC 2.A.3) [Chryseolinea serpens]|uniref:Amino acid/polyamine/organocation transporter, APC superfamily (TC 2.A.3) n=1 Tax=Chryseolinea serpens TaxID=947013 RepID=A0A1M5XTF2_9BACT|nr:amino acid permease [Chryseolinea serpens]SHI03056.1 amino acid/polyamine/organocation transporter, APC superfamily (TC 2.A.3) [Chryseolinea serpens]
MPDVLPPRRLGLLEATAINMTDMVGIGPFITLPMVISIMNGPYFLYAWIAGAVLSFVDATIWSELGAAFPLAGGSYNFLKETYKNKGLGKLMSFLFVWQTMIQAPLVIASAAIGFSAYFSYLVPLSVVETKLMSGGVVLSIIFLLYRRIEVIGKISVFLWIAVMGTILWIILGGFVHGNILQPLSHLNDGLTVSYSFAAALGFASVKSVYSYLGYYNVCHLGGDIVDPSRNIPKSMFMSIGGISILYLLMNISIVSVIPWQEAKNSDHVVSLFMLRLLGPGAATAITYLILVVAFASVFSATLGYSRIPYAAAVDGAFFKAFARTHPKGNFPHVSLLFLGGIAFVFSLLFKLSDVISAILAMRILVQFIGQAVGLLMLRKEKTANFPYKMPFFPWPVYLAIVMWCCILLSTGWQMALGGVCVIGIGVGLYFLKERLEKQRLREA